MANTFKKFITEKYQQAKVASTGSVLLFRMGDFYESYFEDARVVSKAIGLTPTSREGIAMAGFPHHYIDAYLGKLIRSGHRVAVCDLEDKEN